jgi:pimeloyl-ACP methyl ester carboxylesterase
MSRTENHNSTEPSRRALTPTRVVALGLIALLMTGLAYVRFAPGDQPVSVPEDAKAGDLTFQPCDYPTEKGDVAADCGTLVVPETRADPGSRLIALPVTRIRATSEATGPPVFFLTGGPGVSNMNFDIANRFATDRDFVMVGYRGVDGSERLDCPEVDSAIKRASDVLDEEFFRVYAAAYRSCADRLTDEGVDVASYGMTQQVDDLEAARVALGYDRINLLSESAGTRAAMVYSWRYPESIQRSVMVAVNPPGAFLWDADTTDEQIARYAALCDEDASCRARTDDLAATMRRTSDDIPDRWLFLPIKDANVRVLSFFGLMESTSAATPFPAPITIDGWLSAAEGDPSGFWITSVLADLMLPEMFVRGQYAAAAMLDAQAGGDYFAGGPGDLSNLGRAATSFGWAGGRLGDGWPAAPEDAEYRSVRTSDVETLIIGGELDFATPPQVASEELMPYLPNGHEVVLPGFGHTETLFREQPEAGSQLINTFFDSGQVDDSAYVPQNVDFTPTMTFGDIAKVTLAAMLTLAVLTVLSLLLMARRVHTRGRIGRKSSAFVRSIYALVLGLGGWFLGALVVLVTMPAVSIDNELLVILSVGVPIGVATFLAWVHRDWPARKRAIGFAAAAGGALAGAWLGFHAADGLLAPFTAIVGAVAGGNLLLVLHDISHARSVRKQSLTGTATGEARGTDLQPVTPTRP